MVQIDIDMPKQCGECPLCVNYDCIIHKRVTDEYYDILEEQYAHCPLTMPSTQPEPIKINIDDFNKGDWERLKKEWGNTPITVLSVQPEIIRCKDCKFWAYIKRTKRHWCKTDDGLYDLNTSADDFCSRAERRTDD